MNHGASNSHDQRVFGVHPITGLLGQGHVARISGSFATITDRVVFMSCSRYLFASTEAVACAWALLRWMLVVPPNHAFERTRRQRACLRTVQTDRFVALALPQRWRAAQRGR